MDLIALSVSSLVTPDKLAGLKEIYELHVGRETLHAETADGRMSGTEIDYPVYLGI